MMMFPKPVNKKKRKKHKNSILQEKDGTCYLCAKAGIYRTHAVLHEHHIFGGANRPISEAEGLKVYLCLPHHTEGPEAVHKNEDVEKMMHEEGQRAYERDHSRAEFKSLFVRNYLE